MWRWCTQLMFAALLLAAVGPAAGEQRTPTVPAPTAQLAATDRLFIAAYERAVHTVLADAPPAILVLPDRLVLVRRGAQQQWPLIPPQFNELKTVAHVTLGLFAVLSPTNGRPLTDEDRAALTQYQATIAAARTAIESAAGLSQEQRQRQAQILSLSDALAARALADGRMSAADLTRFCRSVRPLVEVNISEAVVAYLDEINRRMGVVLAMFDATERRTYLVIVSGVHQARIDNAAVQYFNRLVGDPPTVAQRVMYAENVFNEAGALHLLGIHLMARRVGDAYFDDPYYMNRDLFAPAAAAYVPVMKLPEGAVPPPAR